MGGCGRRHAWNIKSRDRDADGLGDKEAGVGLDARGIVERARRDELVMMPKRGACAPNRLMCRQQRGRGDDVGASIEPG